MKKTVLHYMMLAVLFATSCTKEEMPAEGPEGAALHVEVRSGTTGTHDVRLFLANRSKEHNNDELHCPEEWRFDLTESATAGTYTYSLTNLLPQWYKMAFVAVPHIEGQTLFPEVTSGENTCDFNKLLIDYSPALQDGINGQPDSPDLAIYREATDGWLEKGKTLTENVQLKRLTGVLELNLGVLKDQFEKRVTQIVLSLRVPTRMYVSDEGTGNLVLTGELQTFTYTYATESQWTSNDDYVIKNIHLLPAELTEAYLGVYEQGKSEPKIYKIARFSLTGSIVEIKSNMRTLLYFNGMEDTEFEVRYAGFDTDDNDAVIGIEDNDWTADGSASEDGVEWPEDSGLGIEDEWTDGGSVSDDGVDWPEDTGNPGT
jgi:hypothetical protein